MNKLKVNDDIPLHHLVLGAIFIPASLSTGVVVGVGSIIKILVWFGL